MEEAISIIIPAYNPDGRVLVEAIKKIAGQNYKGKKEIILIDDCSPQKIQPLKGARILRNKNNLGLANSLNKGVSLARHRIIVTFQQDIIPMGNDWLKNLIKPFENPSVVATVSTLILPDRLWQAFDSRAKLLTAKERGIITPLLDEKACAYRKDALKQAGLFDAKTFRTAGEDFDMYLKLKKVGKIAYPEAKVYHMHATNYKSRMKKEAQLSEGFGALVRIYGTKMPKWYSGILKATPLIGWIIFLITFPYTKVSFTLTFPRIIWLSAARHYIYTKNFWRGFTNKKQTI